jgi:hypothetical protein
VRVVFEEEKALGALTIPRLKAGPGQRGRAVTARKANCCKANKAFVAKQTQRSPRIVFHQPKYSDPLNACQSTARAIALANPANVDHPQLATKRSINENRG